MVSSFCNHTDSVQMIWCFKKGLADITAILSQKGQLSKKKKNQRKSVINFLSIGLNMCFGCSKEPSKSVTYSYLEPC